MERPAFVGVLMLDTRFPRVPGDIGHAASLPFQARCRVVSGASPRRVVTDGDLDLALLEPFIAAGRALVAEGAAVITTSCGFLVCFQQALQAALTVPVFSSSLLALPRLQRKGPCGIVTVDAAALGVGHLRAAGAALDTPIEGLAPGCAFQRTLLDDAPVLDVDAARVATVEAAQRLVERHPETRTIVLECTNMPPYADAVRAATGRAVHDIVGLLRERFPALRR